ncbi:MAG: thiamine pyrophosphate-dependent enzyme, partial [Jiangellales bacterium]
RVDGNDVLACLAVTRAALARAREGSGPMLVEAFTYRMGAHTTSDDPTRYRVAAELEQWRLKDPIERVRAWLVRGGHVDTSFFETLDAEADDLAHRVRDGCRALPEPDPASVFEHVYAGLDPDLRAQRDEVARLVALADDEDVPTAGATATDAPATTAAAGTTR